MMLSTDGFNEDRVAQGWCDRMHRYMGEYYQPQGEWFGGLAGDVSTEHQVLWLDILYVLKHGGDPGFSYEAVLKREELGSEYIRHFRSYLKVGDDRNDDDTGWKQRAIDANDVALFKTTIEKALDAPLFENHPLFSGRDGALPAQIKAREWLTDLCERPMLNLTDVTTPTKAEKKRMPSAAIVGISALVGAGLGWVACCPCMQTLRC